MYKKFISYMVLLFAISFLSVYILMNYTIVQNGNRNTILDRILPKQKEQERDTNQEFDPLKEQINAMTLDEKIGQMLMVGVDGYTLDSNSRKMIEEYKVGGFIILGQNVQSTNQLLNLVNSLKAANLKNKIPIFVSVDEEGGRVDRMPQELRRYPTNREVGQINNSNLSYSIGNVMAEELKSFGFNMNFAPVLDINSNPNNSVIGNRSFGSTSKIVGKLGVETMKGLQSGNVISVVKHFPGHGDTSVDSHIELPTVSNDLNRLKNFEFIPFDEAIKNKADAVMVSHILLSKIDSSNPASFSKAVITDILRKQLNFNGVVITDDMAMGAIVKNYNIGEVSVKSVEAGSDIILVSHSYENEVMVINALRNAVGNGVITKERIDESVYRILKLKQKYELKDKAINSIDVDKINEKINTVLNNY
ncbi:beta-N-acetylhexosaminidase [Clostridium sp. OS1-26]|uniref:beta-N-acetylhexosaminidase n=1 Tax=Clostridium sp. OS1-26 TaxID=3070681 RepID=UPI0027E01FE3|nr:beta-N-acetylhexosaminidase [Clostridium sp. OS1-26]WML33952.1 beta-N-acetylhexosaminidase [Clostridium sp. OS1-26]